MSYVLHELRVGDRPWREARPGASSLGLVSVALVTAEADKQLAAIGRVPCRCIRTLLLCRCRLGTWGGSRLRKRTWGGYRLLTGASSKRTGHNSDEQSKCETEILLHHRPTVAA